MELREKIEADKKMFADLFEQLDKEERFSDRATNTGVEYDDNREYADLIRFGESLKKPGSLSFMGE